MRIELNKHDREIVDNIKGVIKEAYETANFPPAVVKSIISNAMKYRNKGRKVAISKHPFKWICEASGEPLKREDAHLDELEPEKGYYGRVRWVCPKANNSGTKSCGKC